MALELALKCYFAEQHLHLKLKTINTSNKLQGCRHYNKFVYSTILIASCGERRR